MDNISEPIMCDNDNGEDQILYHAKYQAMCLHSVYAV